jgi:AbrB family looped-hinge helix DNA binding protein
MQTRLSSKGQVVLPGPIRRKLGLRAGDELETQIKDGRIVMTPIRTRANSPAFAKDPVSGLPVLTAGPDAAELTTEQVMEILANFP